MSTGRIDPVWDDDLMAIADAVGIVEPSHPERLRNYRPHLSVRGDLSDLALAVAVETFARDIDLDIDPDAPIPFVLADPDQPEERGEQR